MPEKKSSARAKLLATNAREQRWAAAPRRRRRAWARAWARLPSFCVYPFRCEALQKATITTLQAQSTSHRFWHAPSPQRPWRARCSPCRGRGLSSRPRGRPRLPSSARRAHRRCQRPLQRPPAPSARSRPPRCLPRPSAWWVGRQGRRRSSFRARRHFWRCLTRALLPILSPPRAPETPGSA